VLELTLTTLAISLAGWFCQSTAAACNVSLHIHLPHQPVLLWPWTFTFELDLDGVTVNGYLRQTSFCAARSAIRAAVWL